MHRSAAARGRVATMTFEHVMCDLTKCETKLRASTVLRIHLDPGDMRRDRILSCLNMVVQARGFGPERINAATCCLGFAQGMLYAHGDITMPTMSA